MTKRMPSESAHLVTKRPSDEIEQLDNGDPIDRLVLELNAICKAATLDFAIAVGCLVITGCYGGDLGSWRARGEKNASFRKLARHRYLPMSPAALYRSVAIYELCERLRIRRWKHVSTSHLRLVLPLGGEQQSRILQLAEAEGWPVRRLELEVDRVLAEGGSDRRRGGRRRRSRLKATLKALETCVDSSNCFVGFELAVDLSPDSARDMISIVDRIRHACTTLEKRVRPVLVNSTTDPPPPLTAELETESFASRGTGEFAESHRKA